jgi:hypothetical protein
VKNFKPLNKIFLTICVGVSLFLISKFVFDPLNLFYEITWLDIPMHIFGGLLLAALYIYSSEYKNDSRKFKLPKIKNILFFVVLVSAFWEVYEYIMDLSSYRIWNGWLDTISDFINALAGACVAYLAHRHFKGKDF